jgi:peptidoglycan/xylan/chitin deacetylase (PgdA/CDA1 family)
MIESVPPGSFTRETLARWVADGHAVGLHTHTHPDCARLDDDGVRAEIIEPARRLSAELGIASLAFSYPFGRRCSAAHPFRLERASEGDMRFSVYSQALLGFPGSRLA